MNIYYPIRPISKRLLRGEIRVTEANQRNAAAVEREASKNTAPTSMPSRQVLRAIQRDNEKHYDRIASITALRKKQNRLRAKRQKKALS